MQDHNGEIKDKTDCQTLHINDFKKATVLTWTGPQLGSCATEEFDVKNDIIQFKVRSTDGDDFCPKTLTITTDDGYEYKSGEMKDWVDKDKGDNLRPAERTSALTTTTIKTTMDTTTPKMTLLTNKTTPKTTLKTTQTSTKTASVTTKITSKT